MDINSIQPSSTAIIERFLAVLYPFPIERVLDLLPEQGWIVPFGSRDEGSVQLSGSVTKGNVRLVFDLNMKTFGVRGIDPQETVSEFKTVSAFVLDRFGLGPEVQTYFTELRFVGIADTGSKRRESAPEALDRWWAGHERSATLAERMATLLPGDPLAAYGIRMATKGKDANRPEWTELTISPSPTSGTRFYNFDLLYRSADRTRVESVAGTARDIVAAAIDELER